MADGITYGGEPVVLDPDGHVETMLEVLWPASRWPFRDRQANDGLSASTLLKSRDEWLQSPYPVEPVPGLNELIIPTGAARYAKALIVVGGAQMLSIAEQAWGFDTTGPSSEDPEDDILDLTGELPDVWGDAQEFLSLTFELNGVPNTWAMTPLTAIHIDGPAYRNLWLLPLVDRRYFLHRRLRGVSLPLDKTWAEAFTALGTAAGLTISHPAIDAGYLLPDADTFEGEGVSIGHAIDAAALSVGLRAIPGDQGSAEIVLQAADTAITARDTFFDATTNQLGWIVPRPPIPPTLSLVAPRLVNHFTTCDGHDVTTADFGVDSESIEQLTIFTTVWAEEIGGSLDSLSLSRRQTLTNTLAEDLGAWAVAQHAATFAAVPAITITGLDDYYSIGVRDDGSVSGQIKSLPDHFYPRIQLSQSPAIFVHRGDGLILELIDDVSAMVGLTMGNGLAVPRRPNRSTGTLETRVKSDGSAMLVVVWNASSEEITVDAELPNIVQAKNVNCMAVIDVEYCPPEMMG